MLGVRSARRDGWGAPEVMRIAMVGTGYVGLVTGACLAEFGHKVVCIDRDAEKIAALQRGEIPIYEPGLAEIVAANVEAGRLRFASDLKSGCEGAKVIFIAVGTPTLPGAGHADLSHVHAAAAEIGATLTSFAIIAVKSTVPVGSGDEIERIMARTAPRERFCVVSNPEFLREGNAVDDFRHPDRIIVGTDAPIARRIMAEVYASVAGPKSPLLFTSRRSSELIKYAANVYLAMKLTFINEVSDLCEKLDADVGDVADGIGLDPRIGRKFLNAGPGFGGSCFPKDTLAFMRTASDAQAPLRLVETLVEVNELRKHAMAQKIIRACGGSLTGKTIAVLGLTYKPNTDDMRAAPSLTIVPDLLRAGARIVAFDPQGAKSALEFLPGIELARDAYACVADADAMVVVTEWDIFRNLDLARIRAAMREPVVIDLRNIYAAAPMAALGFRYEGLGRPKSVTSKGAASSPA